MAGGAKKKKKHHSRHVCGCGRIDACVRCSASFFSFLLLYAQLLIQDSPFPPLSHCLAGAWRAMASLSMKIGNWKLKINKNISRKVALKTRVGVCVSWVGLQREPGQPGAEAERTTLAKMATKHQPDRRRRFRACSFSLTRLAIAASWKCETPHESRGQDSQAAKQEKFPHRLEAETSSEQSTSSPVTWHLLASFWDGRSQQPETGSQRTSCASHRARTSVQRRGLMNKGGLCHGGLGVTPCRPFIQAVPDSPRFFFFFFFFRLNFTARTGHCHET